MCALSGTQCHQHHTTHHPTQQIGFIITIIASSSLQAGFYNRMAKKKFYPTLSLLFGRKLYGTSRFTRCFSFSLSYACLLARMVYYNGTLGVRSFSQLFYSTQQIYRRRTSRGTQQQQQQQQQKVTMEKGIRWRPPSFPTTNNIHPYNTRTK